VKPAAPLAVQPADPAYSQSPLDRPGGENGKARERRSFRIRCTTAPRVCRLRCATVQPVSCARHTSPLLHSPGRKECGGPLRLKRMSKKKKKCGHAGLMHKYFGCSGAGCKPASGEREANECTFVSSRVPLCGQCLPSERARSGGRQSVRLTAARKERTPSGVPVRRAGTEGKNPK
jgi:hypothetical protein